MYIVELEPGVWLTSWNGAPGRTIKKDRAKQFANYVCAEYGLKRARECCPFENAKILIK